MDVQGPLPSTRVDRPVTISGALGLMGGAGVDVTYQLSDRVALSGQATSLLLAYNEINAQVRFFPLASERAGLYVASGLHGIYAPLMIHVPYGGVSASVGAEFRARNGFTVGGEIGAVGLYAPLDLSASKWGPGVAPRVQLRIGYSF